jgi:hypothetical protein
MTEPVASYVGQHVQIGAGKGGMRPLAQNGRVVIVDGTLQLLDGKGNVLDEGPISEVRVVRARGLMMGVTWVTIRDTRYSAAVGAGGLMLFAGLLRLVKGASGGKKLVAAVEAERARSKS